MTNIIDKILDELPQDIKDKTNIDENLEKLKKTKKIDQNKLLNEIIKELNDTIDKINDNNEKQKLENIKKNLEEYKDSLKKLQAKIGMSPISK
jgi:Zn-dependent oligopeptidase